MKAGELALSGFFKSNFACLDQSSPGGQDADEVRRIPS
jgi:hypothetical protein